MQLYNHLSMSSCHHTGFFFTESCRSCENIHMNISIHPLSVGGPVILLHVDSGKMFGMRLFVWKTAILWFSQQEAFLSSSRNTWRSSASSRLQFKSSAGWNMTTRPWVCLHNSRWALHYWADCPHIYATNQSASRRPLMELPPSTLQTLDVHQAHASRRQEREGERARENTLIVALPSLWFPSVSTISAAQVLLGEPQTGTTSQGRFKTTSSHTHIQHFSSVMFSRLQVKELWVKWDVPSNSVERTDWKSWKTDRFFLRLVFMSLPSKYD